MVQGILVGNHQIIALGTDVFFDPILDLVKIRIIKGSWLFDIDYQGNDAGVLIEQNSGQYYWKYPSSRMAFRTFSAVCGEISLLLLSTRETVAVETPAAFATSLMVTLMTKLLYKVM